MKTILPLPDEEIEALFITSDLDLTKCIENYFLQSEITKNLSEVGKKRKPNRKQESGLDMQERPKKREKKTRKLTSTIYLI